jgi:2-hydroxychromene-2-carboxylate isomerase
LEAVLVSPIFRENGWRDSPFNIYHAKGLYMWRDLERQCHKYNIPFQKPGIFPVNSVQAARVGLVASKEGWAAEWTEAVFCANFQRGLDISDKNVLRHILSEIALSAKSDGHQDILERANTEQIKTQLRNQTAEAATLGIFGAPTFVVDGEIFWGDDRLEQALDWHGQVWAFFFFL